MIYFWHDNIRIRATSNTGAQINQSGDGVAAAAIHNTADKVKRMVLFILQILPKL